MDNWAVSLKRSSENKTWVCESSDIGNFWWEKCWDRTSTQIWTSGIVEKLEGTSP